MGSTDVRRDVCIDRWMRGIRERIARPSRGKERLFPSSTPQAPPPPSPSLVCTRLPSIYTLRRTTGQTRRWGLEKRRKKTARNKVKIWVKLSADPSLFPFVRLQGSEVQCEPILGCVEPIISGDQLFLPSIHFMFYA